MRTRPEPAVQGHVDLDFRRPDAWPAYGNGGNGVSVLLGDETAGPLVFLSSFPPTDEQMPVSFAHAHGADNWRITVRGTTNMGREAYGVGEFRFQDGGVPYPSDNVAWGPDGGFGIVMFADRRGFAIRPVNAEVAERVVPGQVAFADKYGIELHDPAPGAPAIATSAGTTSKGRLTGGFTDADEWDELMPGVRANVALLGDRTCGPVLVHLRAEPGSAAVPPRELASDAIFVVIEGSVTVGDDVLDAGCVRVEQADRPAPAATVGDAGASLAMVIADRRAITSGAAASSAWMDALAARTAALYEELPSPKAAPASQRG